MRLRKTTSGPSACCKTGLDTAYFNRGVAYISLEKWQLAIEDFEKVLAVTTNDNLANEAGKILAQIKNR
ncbi:MAG: tetratricopeptide repeat protein [Bacillota bacterium]|nr:tetratricopeptide repeat protein [Bacillota bacterium]